MSERTLKWLCSYLCVQFWTITIGAFWFYFHMMSSGSPTSDPATFRTSAINVRGDLVFVEPGQKMLFYASLIGGVGGLFLVGLTVQSLLGRDALRELRPLAGSLGIVGGVAFWVAAIAIGGM